MDINAEELLGRTNIGPFGGTPDSSFDRILIPLANLLISLFRIYTRLVFYYHQVLYFVQRTFRYRNRNPITIREDVKRLSKVPRHVAFILDTPPASDISRLIPQATQCALWCLGSGSPVLTVYERSGALKDVSLDSLADAIVSGLEKYFDSLSGLPSISIRSGKAVVNRAGSVSSGGFNDTRTSYISGHDTPDLTIILASEQDGRPMLVKLAQDYSKSIVDGEMQVSDITVDKVQVDVSDRVGEEPDLLVTFASHVGLCNFSPWLLRVTELFCLKDNNNVFHYLVFFRALQKFAKVKINLGS